MKDDIITGISDFYQTNILSKIIQMWEHPIDLVLFLIDIAIVVFLAYKILKLTKDSRAWQVLKGILLLLIVTWLSGVFRLNILHAILDKVISFGVLALIIIFQPEIRRALEQLGSKKLRKYLGFTDDIETKNKEDIYKIVIAAEEMSKRQIGALIVIERDIKIQDIISGGIPLNADVSPQLLVNIFEPKTPLHDGAVVISGNKIAAAACVLPLADDKDIAKELGTRHRAAIGISKESDSIVVVVSEETGKISIAKDGTLIADVREDTLKKILISNVVTKRFAVEKKERKNKIMQIRENLRNSANDKENTKENDNKNV